MLSYDAIYGFSVLILIFIIALFSLIIIIPDGQTTIFQRFQWHGYGILEKAEDLYYFVRGAIKSAKRIIKPLYTRINDYCHKTFICDIGVINLSPLFPSGTEREPEELTRRQPPQLYIRHRKSGLKKRKHEYDYDDNSSGLQKTLFKYVHFDNETINPEYCPYGHATPNYQSFRKADRYATYEFNMLEEFEFRAYIKKMRKDIDELHEWEQRAFQPRIQNLRAFDRPHHTIRSRYTRGFEYRRTDNSMMIGAAANRFGMDTMGWQFYEMF